MLVVPADTEAVAIGGSARRARMQTLMNEIILGFDDEIFEQERRSGVSKPSAHSDTKLGGAGNCTKDRYHFIFFIHLN